MNYYDITVQKRQVLYYRPNSGSTGKFMSLFCVTIFIASKINQPRCDQIIVFFLFSKLNVAVAFKSIQKLGKKCYTCQARFSKHYFRRLNIRRRIVPISVISKMPLNFQLFDFEPLNLCSNKLRPIKGVGHDLALFVVETYSRTKIDKMKDISLSRLIAVRATTSNIN